VLQAAAASVLFVDMRQHRSLAAGRPAGASQKVLCIWCAVDGVQRHRTAGGSVRLHAAPDCIQSAFALNI
jgi:hypothetical protein